MKTIIVSLITVLLSTALSAQDSAVREQIDAARQAHIEARAQVRAEAAFAQERAVRVREQARIRQVQLQEREASVVRERAAQAREQAVQARERATEQRERAVRQSEEARREYQNAQEALREAARKVARLSADLTPARGYAFRFLNNANRAMLGISIANTDADADHSGVLINSVSPGGPADSAGLQSNDVLLAINDVRLDDLGQDDFGLDNPSNMVLEVMSELEPGDEVIVEYVRDGVIDEAVVIAERRVPLSFAPVAPIAPPAPIAPAAPLLRSRGAFFHGFGSFSAGLELVELNSDLGRYFGTSSGLLVINVPDDFPADVLAGDVLKSIDGREPTDPHHAFRILQSYEQGELVTLELLRDRDELDISFEVPESNHPFKGLSMLEDGEVFKVLEGLDFGDIKIRGWEGLQELDLENMESLHILKELPEALSKDFEIIMEDGFINGLHFEFDGDEDVHSGDDSGFQWIEAAEEDEGNDII